MTVRLQSGRVLEVSEGGDRNGVPVFSLHGTPGSRIVFGRHLVDAAKKGIRLIAFNRPGYGGSTRQAGRRIVDGAADVAMLADSLGIDRFAVWGHSGGGAYALACAAVLPGRVVAAASLSTIAPFSADGLDWFSGMGDFNVDDFRLMASSRDDWERKTRKDAEAMVAATNEGLLQMLDSLISEADRGVLDNELSEHLRAQIREGLKPGAEGMIDDNLADGAPWGFDPASITVPLQIWHGRHDKFVPFSHGEWLASHISGCEPHFEEGEGHLSIYVRRVAAVHTWLAAQF